ncbi:MAG TPA: hypothetical protein EYN66_06115 [Myxococcales bacterium]|nr:hypothetical protein [Myxococcales bacterium]
MKQGGIDRRNLPQLFGYRNTNKGLRRLDAWMAGSELPKGRQHELLAAFLSLSLLELDRLLQLDQQELGKRRRENRAQDPHYYLIVRLMAAFYQTQRLPAGTTRKQAISMTRNRAMEWNKLCALNTPSNQTLWFDPKGKVYAISEKGPSMRIGGQKVTSNLI